MAIDYSKFALPKPEPRKRVKARRKRQHAAVVRDIRAYVFLREQNICRICRIRRAESMHEIRPRSLGGRVSPQNSIAVCGNGVEGCHGFAQRHDIWIEGSAEGRLRVMVATEVATAWTGIEGEVER